jgi:hypothetical protein
VIKQATIIQTDKQMSPIHMQDKKYFKSKDPKERKITRGVSLYQKLQMNSKSSFRGNTTERTLNIAHMVGDGKDYLKKPYNKGHYIRNKLLRNKFLLVEWHEHQLRNYGKIEKQID